MVKLISNDFVNSKIKIKDIEPVEIKFRKRYSYKCEICGEEFLTGSTIRIDYRKFCKKHHFFYYCDYCGKEFEIRSLNDFNSDKNLRFCSRNCALQYQNRTEEMKESVVRRNQNTAKNNIKIRQVCKKCGNEFHSIFLLDFCNGCITSNTNIQNNKLDQICSKCGKIFHSPFIMEIGPCCNPNIGGKPKFIIKDEKLYYLDNSNEYVLWEEFKKQFKIVNTICCNLPKEFIFYPTFRTQESTDWAGSKAAFEQSLIDDDIGWFVYIKFYIDRDESIKPLVIGKSGSKLANVTGSDLSFSTDIDDGPAKRFLNDENLEWFKEQIAIIPCNTEQEAFKLEAYYKNNLQLFES